jgi:hypothetical protein
MNAKQEAALEPVLSSGGMNRVAFLHMLSAQHPA